MVSQVSMIKSYYQDAHMEVVLFYIKKSLSSCIEPIDIDCNRVCCMKLSTSIGHIYLYNIYMPCDASNNMYLQQYNDVLSHISIHGSYIML